MKVGKFPEMLACLCFIAAGCGSGTPAAGGNGGLDKVWVTGSVPGVQNTYPRNVKLTLTGHFTLDQPAPGSKLTGTWICQKGIGYPINHKVGENSITLDANTKEGEFTVVSPPSGFNHGAYEFDVSVDGVKKKTVYFYMQ